MTSDASIFPGRASWLRLGLVLFTLVVIGVVVPARAASRQLSLPTALASPGMLVQVPVALDTAAGLASVRAVINFDPQLLELQGVERGALGAQFELAPSSSDGVIQLLFTRDTNLAAGSGRLAVLSFRVRLGALADEFSTLAVADFQVGDQSGVLAPDALSPLLTANGRVTVSSSLFIDNDADGLPDRWETDKGLSMLDADRLGDPDGDGVSNLAEYALGLDPLRSSTGSQLPITATVDFGAARYLAFSFRRLVAPPPGLVYSVEESADLVNWTPVDPVTQQLASPVPQGDGTELVTLRGTLPLTGPEAQPKAFMHLRIDQTTP